MSRWTCSDLPGSSWNPSCSTNPGIQTSRAWTLPRLKYPERTKRWQKGSNRTPVGSSQICLDRLDLLLTFFDTSAHFCTLCFSAYFADARFRTWTLNIYDSMTPAKICLYDGNIARIWPLRCTISSLGSWQFLCRTFGTFGRKISLHDNHW